MTNHICKDSQNLPLINKDQGEFENYLDSTTTLNPQHKANMIELLKKSIGMLLKNGSLIGTGFVIWVSSMPKFPSTAKIAGILLTAAHIQYNVFDKKSNDKYDFSLAPSLNEVALYKKYQLEGPLPYSPLEQTVDYDPINHFSHIAPEDCALFLINDDGQPLNNLLGADLVSLTMLPPEKLPQLKGQPIVEIGYSSDIDFSLSVLTKQPTQLEVNSCKQWKSKIRSYSIGTFIDNNQNLAAVRLSNWSGMSGELRFAG